MRELKFRAWNTTRNCWTLRVELDLLYEKPMLLHGEIENNNGYLTDNTIIEQYTGLKDKNGKEIYEGDILEEFVCGVKMFKGKPCGRRTIWQVMWNDRECCFDLHYLRGAVFGDSLMTVDDEYEVIGNIHENPELLEEEK